MKTLLVASAALAFALSPTAAAQSATTPVADCGPITGTIRVADGDVTPATQALARVSADDARATATRAVAGATVTDVDLDEEDGFLVYEIDLWRDGSEFDVTVDAGSGAVLCVEQD